MNNVDPEALSNPEGQSTFTPEVSTEANEVIPTDQQLKNTYLSKINGEIMSDYEKIGVTKKIGQVSPDGVGKFWDEYHANPANHTNKNKRLSSDPVFSDDGSEIIAYNIYETDQDALVEKKVEVDAIGAESDRLYDLAFQATEEMKVHYLENGAESDGSFTDLGELSDDEYAQLRAKNPTADYSKVKRVFVFNLDGSVNRDKTRVFVPSEFLIDQAA